MTKLDELLTIKEAATWPKEQTPLGEAAVAMKQVVIENPILNSPFGEPTRHFQFSDEEVAKLERWSDDLKLDLEREIKDLDQQIKEIRRETQAATALTEKLAAQKKLKTVESERNRKRRELYDAQDAIDRDRDELIAKIEGQLRMEHKIAPLFVLRWSLG